MSCLHRDEVLPLYEAMVRIRRCEEGLAAAHQKGLVHGACHTCVGQEAVPVGVCAELSPADVVFSTHRGHGHALAKGVPPFQVIAELFGRVDGCSRGRGGSMHLFAPEVGMMGTSGIVAPCILQATGAGYSFQLLGLPHVAVAFFGDGAVNNGAFHEGLNLAGIWKLPVLFVCENNRFATEVPFEYSAASPRVGPRAEHYGMPGVTVDGNDVLAVRAAARAAVERARSGGGPTLIECLTYRTRPHAEGMGDFTYRTRDEVDDWKERCPIVALGVRLISREFAGERVGPAELDDLAEAIQAELDVDFVRAEAAAWPDPATAADHIYAEPRSVPDPPPPPGGRQLTYARATLEALTGEMERDPTLFVLGEGIGKRGGNFASTLGLYDRFGAARLRDTPISERGFMGLCAGAAMTGTRPIADMMFWDFALDGIGEVVHQISRIRYMSSGRLRMPVVIRGCVGIGHSAATHHSGNHVTLLAHYPGLRVVVPATPYDAKGLLTHALRGEDPVCFIEPRELLGTRGPVPQEAYELPFGRAAVVREGSALSVVTFGAGVPLALKAAGELEREGIGVEVVDLRTIAPLDRDTVLASVEKTGRLLVLEEGFAPFGVAAEVAAVVADAGFDALDAPIRRLSGVHAPTPYSPPLEATVVPTPARVVEALRALLAE